MRVAARGTGLRASSRCISVLDRCITVSSTACILMLHQVSIISQESFGMGTSPRDAMFCRPGGMGRHDNLIHAHKHRACSRSLGLISLERETELNLVT